MTDELEREIRRALEAKALEVDVPDDLAARTLAAAREANAPRLRERLRGWRDARSVGARVTGYPRWLYAGAAAAAAVGLYALGSVVTMQPGPTPMPGPAAFEQLQRGGGEAAELPATGGGAVTSAETAATTATEDIAAVRGRSSAGAAQAGPDIAPIEPPAPGRPGSFPPKIVRTADLEVEVRNFDRAWDAAMNLASRHDGFVTNSNTEQINGKLGRGTLTMRVPATKLDAALRDLRRFGKLVRMSSSGADVSAQLVDLDARTRALEAEELQLLELLKRASGVSQVLEVRDRLNAVRQEIESLKAQKELYEDQVAYSTINATLFESGAEPDEEPGDGIIIQSWRTALRAGLVIVGGALVVLGGLVPLAALGLGTWSVVRVIRRRRS